MRDIKKVSYLTVLLSFVGIFLTVQLANVDALQIDTETWGTKYSKNVYYFGNKNVNGKTYLEVSQSLSGAAKEQVLFCDDAIIGGFDSDNYSLADLDAIAQQPIKVYLYYEKGSQPLCVSLIDIGSDWNVSGEKPVIDIDIEPSIIWIWDRQPTLKITGTLIKGSNPDANLKYYVDANQSFADNFSFDFENSNGVKVQAKGSMYITDGKTASEIVTISGPVDNVWFSFHDRFNNPLGGTSVEYHNFGLFRTSSYSAIYYLFYATAVIVAGTLIYKRSIKNKKATKSVPKKRK